MLEQVREELVKWMWCQEAGYTWSEDAVDDYETRLAKESYRKKADQILSIKLGSHTLKEIIQMIENEEVVKVSEDQSLPKNPYGLKSGYDYSGSFAMVDTPERRGYEIAQHDMVKKGARFVESLKGE